MGVPLFMELLAAGNVGSGKRRKPDETILSGG